MKNESSVFSRIGIDKYINTSNLKRDLPASLVVFLVALPLCLGIALASGAPLFAGLISGIVGGIIVASISGSQLSVSGPAAGLTVIVLGSIAQLGSYQVFLLAVVLAGALQLILGLIKAGTIGNYFPSSVIEGMLAAIGLMLILKQIPLALGLSGDLFSAQLFAQGDAIGDRLQSIVGSFGLASVVVSVVSIAILIYLPKVKALKSVPAPLLVVVFGVVIMLAFQNTTYQFEAAQMVNIPVVNGWGEFTSLFQFPQFSAITSPDVWVVAGTIAIVASLETLLSIEAVDKIDPLKRLSPTNRELVAQGVGNMTSGMLGGLPMTSVIVRSSANVNSGGKSKMSSIFHGIWLLLSLLFIPAIINMIPLACLAAILLVTGYKLARITLFKHMYHKGWDQFVPFMVTIVAILLTDLLKGVAIGVLVSIFYLLRISMRNPFFYRLIEEKEQKQIRIKLAEEVTFLNKAAIQVMLMNIPRETNVIIDGSAAKYIDPDVLEVIRNYKHNAYSKAIIVQLEDIKDNYVLPQLITDIYTEEKNKKEYV